MEKSFPLDQREAALVAQADQERTQALAMIGALSLDMESARKNLDNAAERQRAVIRQCLATRGIDRYDNARTQNNQLVVSLPDAPLQPPQPPEGMKVVDRVNGAIAEAKE